MSNIQYTTLIFNALNDMKERNPNMTFGEILYTVFRKENYPGKTEDMKTSWFLKTVDKDIYNAVERAIKTEAEDED